MSRKKATAPTPSVPVEPPGDLRLLAPFNPPPSFRLTNPRNPVPPLALLTHAYLSDSLSVRERLDEAVALLSCWIPEDPLSREAQGQDALLNLLADLDEALDDQEAANDEREGWQAPFNAITESLAGFVNLLTEEEQKKLKDLWDAEELPEEMSSLNAEDEDVLERLSPAAVQRLVTDALLHTPKEGASPYRAAVVQGWREFNEQGSLEQVSPDALGWMVKAALAEAGEHRAAVLEALKDAVEELQEAEGTIAIDPTAASVARFLERLRSLP